MQESSQVQRGRSGFLLPCCPTSCSIHPQNTRCHSVTLCLTPEAACTGAAVSVQHCSWPLPSLWSPVANSQTSCQQHQGGAPTWGAWPGALCGGRMTWKRRGTSTPSAWSRGAARSSNAALHNGTSSISCAPLLPHVQPLLCDAVLRMLSYAPQGLLCSVLHLYFQCECALYRFNQRRCDLRHLECELSLLVCHLRPSSLSLILADLSHSSCLESPELAPAQDPSEG